MDQTSNSLLGKPVRSRRALHVVGNALLKEDADGLESEKIHQHAAHEDAIDLRQQPPAYTPQPQPQYKRASSRGSSEPDAWVPLVDPRKVIKTIADAKKLIAIFSLLGLLAGVLLAMVTPKYYYATAEILIDPRDLQISDRELLPTGLPYDASLALVENQTRILTSRRVIAGTVEKLSLDQDAEYNGKGLGAPNPVTALKTIVFGNESDDPSKAKELAVENLLKATGVSRAPKTFVISLTVRSEDSAKSALIANTMAEVYMAVQDEIQSDTVGRANGELGGRLEELRSDVEKAERLVEAYRSENELFDANGKLITDDEISLSSTQLTRAREKVSELRARADSARELTVDAVLSDALPEGAASALIAELRRGYAGKVQQRDALAEKLGAQHPQLRTAEAEVTSAQRGIETELRRLSQTAQIELQRAIKTEQDLAAGQARLKSKKSSISESLVRLRELEREAAARRSVYESFLLRARETGQQAGISTANTTIVSKAVAPLRTYGTSRKLIAIGGLVAGFMLGILFALLGMLWRSITQVQPDGPVEDDNHQTGYQSTGSPAPLNPAPSGSGSRIFAQHQPEQANDNPKTGEPMYYPYPAPAMMQHGPMNGMMVPQPMMQQPVMPQMMQSAPYGYPMMQQMMPQPMMQPYGYPQMMPQMMQPMMQQPVMQQPVIQPVYVAMPQPAAPVYQPSYQPAPVQQSAPAPQEDSNYAEIRGRLEALRNGIVNLADGRDRLSKLG
jgi:polysaccharide biosynthesis transport protein